MRRMTFLPLLIAVGVTALPLGCKRTDPELAARIREEIAAWRKTLPQIPEGENGAIPVMEGAEALADIPDRWQDGAFDASDPEQLKALEAYLKDNAEALETLEKGLAMDRFFYASDLDKGSAATIPSLTDFRKAGQVLILRSRLHRAGGNETAAADDVLRSLKLGISLSRDPLLISHMIAVATEREALCEVLSWLSKSAPEKAVLARLLEDLKTLYATRGTYQHGIDGEYYVFQLTELAKAAAGEIDFKSDYQKDYANIKGWYEKSKAIDCETYWKTMEAQAKAGEPDPADMEGSGFAAIAIPNLNKAAETATGVVAIYRGTALALAAYLAHAESGAWPESLDSLKAHLSDPWPIDPFSGKPLIYRKGEKGFTAYSVGPNGKDDKGETKPVFDLGKGGEQKDLVFQ